MKLIEWIKNKFKKKSIADKPLTNEPQIVTTSSPITGTRVYYSTLEDTLTTAEVVDWAVNSSDNAEDWSRDGGSFDGGGASGDWGSSDSGSDGD